MTAEKRRFWIPLTGLLLASAAAIVCNIGSTADPMGELSALNFGMTALFLAAWGLFFIFFKSKSKSPYIVSLVYWLFILMYPVCVAFPVLLDLIQYAGPLAFVWGRCSPRSWGCPWYGTMRA